MRLNYIKLVGFKSFVDATKVPFPDQMTCVVGPNGCGKSNVIDAVRWVLGESSAKNLRGDAMTDVIFNGSSSRKPISRASVELVFDNREGRLQGEYAGYQEVSVKRLVTRDGQSSYFLNGSKCRRRDITDIFLGTGLGPRSYAIIEQGMISRLIESKPQELRVFIEEAAGISKYKERRKETESRMRKTHENLERLTDVRDELAQQLAKLQRQAAAATRYKALKNEERLLKAQLQALRWLHYQQQCERVEKELQQQQTELERWVAEQRGSERGQTALREQQHTLKQQLDVALQHFYQCNNDITRLEQSIQHQRQLAQQRQRDAADIRLQQRQLEEEQTEEREQYEILQAQLLELSPEIEVLQAQQAELDEQLSVRQAEYDERQQLHQQAAAQTQEKRQSIALLNTQIEGIEALVKGYTQQLQSAQQRLQNLQAKNLSIELAEAETNVARSADKNQQLKAELNSSQQAVNQAQQQVAEAQSQVHETEASQRDLQGRLKTYQSLLASSAEHLPEDLSRWLVDKEYAPLRELVQIAAPWQAALAKVAQPWLNAAVLLPASAKYLADAPQTSGALMAIELHREPPAGSLAARISGMARHLMLFQMVALLDTDSAAHAQLQASGFDLGVDPQGRLYYADAWQADSEDSTQVLQWQKQVEDIESRLPALEQSLQHQQQALTSAQQTLQHNQRTFAELQQQERQLHAQQAEARVQLSHLQRQLTEQVEQREELEDAIEQLNINIVEEEAKSQLLVEQGEQLNQHLDTSNADLEQATETLHKQQRDLQAIREQQQQGQQSLHQALLQAQQTEQSITHLQTNVQRNEQRNRQLTERLQQLLASDTGEDTELAQAELEDALARRMQAEEDKNEYANALAHVDSELAVLNEGQQGVEQKIEAQRAQVEASKLSLTASRERGHSLLEGLQDTGYALKEVLAQMPDDADETIWQQRLDKIARALQQLGAINLAAIEEAEAQGERKAYLDAQFDDLTESLSLLEAAIKTIDKETRQRFRKTFEQVNQDLGELFPKVFGGGHAYLALTDDDMLDTGVTIMARPPGKKNSTIHLLSGGEKALTALSLVFAIFRLNPAPFCMLDEVDAPLDDANVGRFCRLVQEMSESVQFIYISHNKIAMEMATHLAGVTMQEPGVSRLVAVDVDEAVAMAEAS